MLLKHEYISLMAVFIMHEKKTKLNISKQGQQALDELAC